MRTLEARTDARPRDDEWPRVSVVIPALNEAENLPHVLATLPSDIYELVLVDGNSDDGTSAVARSHYPRVRIVGQSGRGKGNALQAGFAACSGDIVVMMDADGSTDGGEIARFVEALLGGADYAKGSRFVGDGRSEDITPLRRAGNRFLCALVNRLFGTSYTDLCYGYNAFWRRVVPQLALECDGFEVETLLNVRAAKAGLAVVEVPSVEHARLFGVSKLSPLRDGLRILRTIMRESQDRPPWTSAAIEPVSAEAGGVPGV
jgi:glycosyltransferase involved in cell wall biosynthesis